MKMETIIIRICQYELYEPLPFFNAQRQQLVGQRYSVLNVIPSITL